jgi:hypothetical protein
VKSKGKSAERAVLITTEYKGVFFGYATETDGDVIHLRAARLCIYWAANIRGFMGLASHGPSKECRIGPRVDIEVRKITSVVEVTDAAKARWEEMP